MKEIVFKKDGVLVGDIFIKTTDIITNCNLSKIKEDKLFLLKMEWRSRRGFDGITEKIVLTDEKINIIKKHIIGKEIYFGEIAGKHSKIYGTLDDNELEITKDVDTINAFLASNPSGHEYIHSFIYTFIENGTDNEEFTDEEKKELYSIFS